MLELEPDGWQREYVTGPFRLDFYCPLARLAVEVDGGSHLGREARERDDLRDEWHKARKITTMRVSADHVERDLAGVLEEIRQRLRVQTGQPVPHAPPPVTSPLADLAADMLGQAEALRASLQQQVDDFAAALFEEQQPDLEDGPPSVVVDDAADAEAQPAPGPSVDLAQEEELVAAQIRMALLAAEAGGNTRAAERQTQRLIAEACRPCCRLTGSSSCITSSVAPALDDVLGPPDSPRTARSVWTHASQSVPRRSADEPVRGTRSVDPRHSPASDRPRARPSARSPAAPQRPDRRACATF